ncbi:MAG TPA: extracellular solute-binding protein [Thermotogota bacterium]|nr:extracellular solute-binding protein [Thermotogota bacterium]HRW33958.1 extracellular solute-binding protein [Thermotogota bacterium]
MSKKFVVVFLVLVMIVTISLAKTKLVLWQFMMDDATGKQVVEEFEKANPDIEVEFVQLSWANGFDKIVTAFAADAAPDVLELGNTWVANFAEEGVLSNMDWIMETNKDIVGWNSASYKGDVWGVPWLLGTRAMFYNIDLFEKAGLNPENPPATWAEILEATEKIEALGNEIYGFGLASGEPYSPWQEWFLPAVWGNNGKVVSTDLTTSLFNSIEVVEAAQFYQKLSKYAMLTKQDDLMDAFGDNKIGMVVGGAHQISALLTSYPETKFMVTFVPKPSNEKGFHASFAGGEVLTIPDSCDHKAEALKLVEYLVDPEVAMRVTKGYPAVFPSNITAQDDPWFEDHPLEYVFFEQNATAVPVPPTPQWTKIQEKVTEAVEALILDKADVKATLDKYSQQIQDLLDQQ